jgi:hypothetical protein
MRDAQVQQGDLWLWSGILVPPLAFLLNLQLSYVLVSWACATGHTSVLHITALLALVLSAGSGILGWKQVPAPVKPPAGAASRRRFMALLGLWTGILFSLVVVAQWIPNLFLSPCQTQ